jgi:hypothetical protein
LRITRVAPGFENLLGARILRIGGVKAEGASALTYRYISGIPNISDMSP